MSKSKEFWTKPEAWPRQNRYTFLALVVHDLGKSLFPEHWTGEEPYVDLPPTASEAESRYEFPVKSQRAVVSSLRAMPASPDRISGAASILRGLEARPKFNRDEAQRLFDAAMPAYERFLYVVASLQSQLVSRQTKAFAQNIAGGQLSTIPDVWSNVDMAEVVRTCRIKLGPTEKWIFLASAANATKTIVADAAKAPVQMTGAVFPLEEIVKAKNLDGFKDVFWNFGQVVAWVETRSPFPVDALSDSTKDLARRDHSMPAGLPHFAAELADRCADENGLAIIKSPFESVDDLRRAVLRSFQSGLLTASGQRRGSFDREPIDPLEWADLTMDDSLAGEMTVRHRDGFVEAWTDVRVKGADVISAFPMPAVRPENVRIVENRKGSPPTYDWSDAMEFAVMQLNERGDFSRPENAQAGWRSQADLMRLVIEYMAKFNNGNEPSDSSVKDHLKTTIANWRLGRQ